MDAATLRLIGRNRVIDDLLRAGIHAAIPVAEGSGVDLFAYSSPKGSQETWVGAPLRVRASSGRAFGIDEGAERIPGLLHAFVWGVGSPDERVYVLNHREARRIAEQMGFALPQTGQFALYEHQAPVRSLMDLIEPFRITPEMWREKLGGAEIGTPVGEIAASAPRLNV